MVASEFVQEQLGRVDIPMDGLGWLFGDQRHADGGSKVVHSIDSMASLLDAGAFAQVRSDDSEFWVGLQMLEVLPIAGAKVVDDDHFVTAIEKELGKVTQLRFVNYAIVSLSYFWFVIACGLILLLSIADDPGLPVVVTVIETAVTAVGLLFLFYRRLLKRALNRTSDN